MAAAGGFTGRRAAHNPGFSGKITIAFSGTASVAVTVSYLVIRT